MFEQTFKNIDDILHKDAGCGSELDYVEQTSWVLFLKYLDDFEKDREAAAGLKGEDYKPIIQKKYRWGTWAAPKTKDGELDHHAALTGDDLGDFVNDKLWKYLSKFKQTADSPNTIEYKIGEIFGELKNRVQSGYNLREVINRVDELRFQTSAEKHEMSHLYEDKIKSADLADFVSLQKKKKDSENSWSVKVANIDAETFDLSVKNPNRQDLAVLREPEAIVAEMRNLDKEAALVLKTIEGLI